MPNPYHPPESQDRGDRIKASFGAKAPVIGCLSGGCLIPILLFLACAIFLKDTGGPLFWPLIAVPLGILGLVLGFAYRFSKE